MNDKEFARHVGKFVKWSRKAAEMGLLNCSSGNISYKLNDEIILVSQSRCWLGNIKKSQVTLVNIADGSLLKGNNPTGELPLHLAIHSTNKEVNTVLHCQAPAATALACRQSKDIDYNVIIEVPIYIGSVIHLPYLMPGSEELGKAVAEASQTASVIQLQNHGQVVLGRSLKETIQKAVFFEFACQILIMNGLGSASLTQEQIGLLKNYR